MNGVDGLADRKQLEGYLTTAAPITLLMGASEVSLRLWRMYFSSAGTVVINCQKLSPRPPT